MRTGGGLSYLPSMNTQRIEVAAGGAASAQHSAGEAVTRAVPAQARRGGRRTARRAVAAAAVVCGALLAACGGDETAAAPPGSTPPPPQVGEGRAGGLDQSTPLAVARALQDSLLIDDLDRACTLLLPVVQARFPAGSCQSELRTRFQPGSLNTAPIDASNITISGRTALLAEDALADGEGGVALAEENGRWWVSGGLV